MEVGPWDMLRVTLGILSTPHLGCFTEGDSRVSSTTSNGSKFDKQTYSNIQIDYMYFTLCRCSNYYYENTDFYFYKSLNVGQVSTDRRK